MEKEPMQQMNTEVRNEMKDQKIGIESLDKKFQDAKKVFEDNPNEENLNEMHKAFDEIVTFYQTNMEETEIKQKLKE